jgi:hypothetical protein
MTGEKIKWRRQAPARPHKTAAASIKGKSAMADTMPQRAAAAGERAHADGGDETANERGRSVAYSHALKRQQVTIAPHTNRTHPRSTPVGLPTGSHSSLHRATIKLAGRSSTVAPEARSRASNGWRWEYDRTRATMAPTGTLLAVKPWSLHRPRVSRPSRTRCR